MRETIVRAPKSSAAIRYPARRFAKQLFSPDLSALLSGRHSCYSIGSHTRHCGLSPSTGMMRACARKTVMNANLFSRLFEGLDDIDRVGDRDPRRPAHQLWRSDRPAPGRWPMYLRARGVKTGRPRRRANGKVGFGPGALSRRAARRRGLSAAQHRLHAERARVFHRRCRTRRWSFAIPRGPRASARSRAEVGAKVDDARRRRRGHR